MGYNLLINGVYWGYNPFTNLLLTSWGIQVGKMDEIVHRGSGMKQVSGLMKSFIDMRQFPEVTYLENLGKYHFC